jgi:transcriptional regulator with XRE-family HTH domain
MTATRRRRHAPPNRLRELREAQGLTLEAVARTANIGTTTLAHYELGTRKLTVPKIEMLASVLQVTPHDILNASSAGNGQSLTADEIEILKRLRTFSPQQRKLLIRLFDQWRAAANGQKKAKRSAA